MTGIGQSRFERDEALVEVTAQGDELIGQTRANCKLNASQEMTRTAVFARVLANCHGGLYRGPRNRHRPAASPRRFGRLSTGLPLALSGRAPLCLRPLPFSPPRRPSSSGRIQRCWCWTDQPLHVEPRPQEALEVHEVHEVHEVLRDLDEHEPAQEFAPLPQFAEAFQVSEVLEVLEVLEVPEVHEVLEVNELYEVPEVHEVAEISPFLEIPQAAEVPMHLEPAHVEPLVESRNLFQFAETRASVSEPDADLAERAASIGFGGRVLDVLRAGGSHTLTAGGFALKGAARVGEFASDAIGGVGPLGDVALWCLTRGAALVSTASVLMLLTLNRADLFSRWNRLTETVAAAAAATRPQPPPPIASSRQPSHHHLVRGQAAGDRRRQSVRPSAGDVVPVRRRAPVARSRSEGIGRAQIHVDAGETAELNEEIYPGWVAVASAVDLTFTENGRRSNATNVDGRFCRPGRTTFIWTTTSSGSTRRATWSSRPATPRAFLWRLRRRRSASRPTTG